MVGVNLTSWLIRGTVIRHWQWINMMAMRPHFQNWEYVHTLNIRRKIKKYYPSLQGDIMQKFYGFAASRKEKELWNKYDSFYGMTHHVWLRLVITKLVNKMPIKWGGTTNINMSEFFSKTSPSYYISHCKFEHIDCRRFWTKVTTINGVW